MTHALIIGGGIAGPITAMALARAGVSATVYEAYPAGAALDAGAWLTVAVNGLSAMKTVGVERRVMGCGFASRTIEFMSGTGKPLGAVPLGGELADGTVTHTLKRAELHRVLHDEALRRGIRFEHGKRLAHAEQRGERVVARFADGSEALGDLLIGADGIHSQVRRLLDAEAPSPRYAGLGNLGGFSPPGSSRLAPCSYRMIFGKRCFFGLAVAPSGDVWWFANPPWPREPAREELAANSVEDWRAQLLALLRDDATEAAAVVESATDIVGTAQYDLPKVPVWRRGRIVIIGDAAHAASPASGQGASMAAEDAVALAECVRRASSIPEALEKYEQLRRQRVERVVAHGARMGNTKTVGPFGRVLRDMMMPFILKQLGKSQGKGSLDWLFQHEVAGA
jgi:FAD-dependent urate hydroxylase